MFIGLSNNPGNADGGCVALVDSMGNLTPEYRLDEQGVIDMLIDVDNTLIVPGPDPDPDSWAFGNLYTRTIAGTWTKYRNMTNVIHSLGCCLHNGNLYVSTGAHIGDNQTWEGRVFLSEDQGETWSSYYDCYYRVYDIISYGNLLYVTAWDYPNRRVFSSSDSGVTWSLVSGVEPMLNPRMVIWNNLLIGVTVDGNLFSIDSVGTITNYSVPESIVSEWNTIAQYNGILYILTGNHIWKSNNLTDWLFHCDLLSTCVSISVMDGEGLVVSEVGPDARLLLVPFTT